MPAPSHTTDAKQNQKDQVRSSETAKLNGESSPVFGAQHSLLSLHRSIGNHAFGQVLQAKLAISSPGDAYEQEADRVADEVMNVPEHTIQRNCASCSQESCACPHGKGKNVEMIDRKTDTGAHPANAADTFKYDAGNESDESKGALSDLPFSFTGPWQSIHFPVIRRMMTGVGDLRVSRRLEPDEMAEQDDLGESSILDGTDDERVASPAIVQTKAKDSRADAPSPHVEHYVNGLDRAGGQPLTEATRNQLEPRFRHDFSHVRVHTDGAATKSARSINAKAYTVGRHIVFAEGQYSPNSIGGQHLLAHELTHTIQQSSSSTASKLSPMIQRAPWGPCSTGKELPVRGKPFRYGAAEFGMLAYYGIRRGSNCWASNLNLFEEMSCPGESGKMIRQFADYFRSGKNPVRRRSVVPSTGVPSPDDKESVLEALKGAEPAIEEVFTLLRPDIIDFTKREIYDVTTDKQAPKKTSKIKGYAKLATTITGRTWTAGTTLPSPGPFILNYRYRKGEIICYGPTDLNKYPGVLAYKVIQDKKSKSKKSKDDKKEKKQTDKKDEKEGKPSPPGRGGNIGFGIGIMSTGGGSGNATLGVSIMSNGQAYGTVSGGVVYGSDGKAVGAITAGGSASSSSTGAGVVSVGAGTENTSVAVAGASLGTGSNNTSAAAAVASASSGKGNLTAAAGVASRGESEGNITAGAGMAGKGSLKGVVGASAGQSGGTTTGTQGKDVTSGTGGKTQSGQTKGTTSPTDGGDTAKEGQTGASTRANQSKYGLNIPGQSVDDANKAVEKAADMDALLQKVRPAQKALMEYLAQKEGDNKYAVPGVEWVKIIMTATENVSNEDLAYLITLEWRVGNTTAEKLRDEIQRALKRKKAGDAPGIPVEVEPKNKLPVPKEAPKGSSKTKPSDEEGVPSEEGKNKKSVQPKESQRDRLIRLTKRARDYADWGSFSTGIVSYGKEPKPGEIIAAQLYVKAPDPQGGGELHLTADVTGTIVVNEKERVFIVHSSSELVTSDDRSVPAGRLNGAQFRLEP